MQYLNRRALLPGIAAVLVLDLCLSWQQACAQVTVQPDPAAAPVGTTWTGDWVREDCG
jgi:hypothetical protein